MRALRLAEAARWELETPSGEAGTAVHGRRSNWDLRRAGCAWITPAGRGLPRMDTVEQESHNDPGRQDPQRIVSPW